MSDDFDRVLRESLQHRADDSQPVDLAAGALRQAGRIKRRRTLATGAGALAIVAVAVPIGVQVAGEAKDHTASKPTSEDANGPVHVTLAGLSEGSPPAVPYIDGDKFHDRDMVSLPTADGPVIDAVQVTGGALYWTLDSDTGKTSVQSTDPDIALPAGVDVSSPTLNRGEHTAAWSIHSKSADPAGDEVVAVDTEDGSVASSRPGDKVLRVMGFSTGSALYNGRVGKKRIVAQVDPATGAADVPWPDAMYVTAADSELWRVAGRTRDMTGHRAGCTLVKDLQDVGEDWESCDWRPVEFSSDGTLVLAVRPETDGLGPSEIAVLNAASGRVERVFATEGTFGRATFDFDPVSMIAVLADGDQVAIVRCGIESGTCERATPAVKVTPDDPESLVSPYQLTAN